MSTFVQMLSLLSWQLRPRPSGRVDSAASSHNVTCSRSKKTEQLNMTLLRAHVLVQAPAPCEERYSNEPVRRERRAIYHINITSVQSPDTISDAAENNYQLLARRCITSNKNVAAKHTR